MEITDIACQIQEKIDQLEVQRNRLQETGKTATHTQSYYDKELAKTILMLRNTVDFVWEGERITHCPVSIVDKVARGICYQEKIDAELSQLEHDNVRRTIDVIQSQLMALQSIYKHLGVT